MRHAYLLLALACAACHAMPTARDGATLVLAPKLGAERQVLAAPYAKADIDHLQVRLYDETAGHTLIAWVAVPKASLDKTVTVGNLQHAKTYRVQTDAYLDAGEATLISDPARSTVDVTTDADFHQPTVAAIPVRLLDGTFAGTATSGFTITDGVATGVPTPGLKPFTTTTLAGNGTAGHLDGTGTAAEFNGLPGLAVDASDNLYVSDGNNLIRKVTPAGVVTTLAGDVNNPVAGAVDGTGAAARFNGPYGIAVDAGGTVYVAEAGNHCIRKITPAGVVTTLAGDITTHSPGAADGTGAAARFNAPRGLALDPDGNLLVADLNNHCLRKVTPAGVVTTLVGDITTHLSGSTDGTGAAARLAGPNGVAVASDGTIYVAEGTQRIRKVTPAGATSRFAGSNTGAQDGLGIAAKFNQPASIAIDRNDVLYVAEFSNHLIRQIKPSGLVTTIAGDISTHTAGFADGIGPTVRLFGPVGIVCGRDGTLYVGDSGNNRIRMM